MAANSIREQLIQANYDLIASLDSITTTQRVQPTYAELSTFAQTQFPVAAIVGRLPVPVPKNEGRGVPHDQYIMSLTTDIFIYVQVALNADTLISSISDDLWAILLTNQSRSGLAFDTVVKLDDRQKVYRPFAAFQMQVINKYVTGNGGL